MNDSGAEDYRHAGHPRGEELADVYLTAALRQVDAGWWLDRRHLARRVLRPEDLVEDAGIARHRYGGLLAAVEAVMTEQERAQVTAIATGD
ncbi:hypothetical protein [Micromonospora aurantiaca (nom. illeg.)]|uniref:hypothetical protein n=1 Tax=Micromonospora aurantiaca (nom. illeg.) TaxID=47850 RepID=UPI0033F44009